MTFNGPERLSFDQKTRIRYLIRLLSVGGRNSKKQVRLFVSFALQAFVLFEIESNIENLVNRSNSKAPELKKLKQLALILNTKPLNLEKARNYHRARSSLSRRPMAATLRLPKGRDAGSGRHTRQ
jgi:hypothetical protein